MARYLSGSAKPVVLFEVVDERNGTVKPLDFKRLMGLSAPHPSLEDLLAVTRKSRYYDFLTFLTDDRLRRDAPMRVLVMTADKQPEIIVSAYSVDELQVSIEESVLIKKAGDLMPRFTADREKMLDAQTYFFSSPVIRSNGITIYDSMSVDSKPILLKKNKIYLISVINRSKSRRRVNVQIIWKELEE